METKTTAIQLAPSELRVLVADDELTMRELLKAILRTLRIENITLVGDGKQALENYRKDSHHMVFLDIDMPVMDGYSVLQEIRKIDNTGFVVMVSGHGAVDNIKKSLELGAQGFVVKPYTSSRIADMLKKFRNAAV